MSVRPVNAKHYGTQRRAIHSAWGPWGRLREEEAPQAALEGVERCSVYPVDCVVKHCT